MPEEICTVHSKTFKGKLLQWFSQLQIFPKFLTLVPWTCISARLKFFPRIFCHAWYLNDTISLLNIRKLFYSSPELSISSITTNCLLILHYLLNLTGLLNTVITVTVNFTMYVYKAATYLPVQECNWAWYAKFRTIW